MSHERVLLPPIETHEAARKHLEDFHTVPAKIAERQFPAVYHAKLHAIEDPIMIPHEHEPENNRIPGTLFFRRKD